MNGSAADDQAAEAGAARYAVLSVCGAFRYRLGRRWDVTAPALCFVMLNPSTADGRDDDATIRKCIGFWIIV